MHDVAAGYSNFSGLFRPIVCIRLIFWIDRNSLGFVLGFGSSGERNASANGFVSIENFEDGAFLQRGNHLCPGLEPSHLLPS
jgi:hypothetical protein